MKPDGTLHGDPWWAAILSRSPHQGVSPRQVGPCCLHGAAALWWNTAVITPLYTWTRRYAW